MAAQRHRPDDEEQGAYQDRPITGTFNLVSFIDTAGGQRKAFVMFQRGPSQDPATHDRYRTSKAPWPWTVFEKGVLESIYQQPPLQIADEN